MPSDMEVVSANGVTFQVDEADLPLLEGRSWRVYSFSKRTGRHWYVVSQKEGGKALFLHRHITGAATGHEVDHLNGDGLDNRRTNLRIVSHALNLANQRPQSGRSSRFKGVSWDREKGRWHAYIKVGGRRRHLGYFHDERIAATAYNAAAIEAWGEHARPNVIEEVA